MSVKFKFTTKNIKIELYKIVNYPTLDYRSKIVESIYKIDEHNHSKDKGKNITPSSIEINEDLNLEGYGLTNLKGLKFNVVEESLGLNSLYIKENDFYMTDGLDNEVRLTEGGQFLTGAGEIILGDYITSNAEILYNSENESYYFTNAPGSNANIGIRNLILSNSNEGSLTLKASDIRDDDYQISFSDDPFIYGGVWKIDGGNNITTIKYTDSYNPREVLVKVGGVYKSSPIKLNHFPSDSPYKVVSVNSFLEVGKVDTSVVKIPEVSLSSQVEGGFGVEGGEFKLFTNTWNTVFSQELPTISLNIIQDVDIENPQTGQFLRYDSETKKFFNSFYPTVSYEDLLNKPNDITDLQHLNIQELGDVSNQGWGNPASESRVLKYNVLGNLELLPDGGDVGLWGAIGGDIGDNLSVKLLAEQYLNLHEDIKHLNTSDSLFALQDVKVSEGVDVNTTDLSEGYYILRWRREEPESEENFDGKFELEPFQPSGLETPEFQLKGQLFSYFAEPPSGVTALPFASNIQDYNNYQEDKVLALTRNLNNTSVLRHIPLDELEADVSFIRSVIIKEGEKEFRFPTESTRAYKIKIMNHRGTGDVIMTFGEDISVGCLARGLERFTIPQGSEGEDIVFYTTQGFEGEVIITVYPYILKGDL